MTTQAKRNELCPCGSGKKYKKCCLLKDHASRPITKTLLGDASTKAVSLLLDYARDYPEPIPTPPLSRPVPELPDTGAQNTLQNDLLAPWILYLWHPSCGSPQTLPSDRTIVARFLRQKGDQLDGFTRRYMEAARLEPFSYWQVEGIEPGKSLLLKDMVTGEERLVCDVSSSNMAARWDIFLAQVVGLDGTCIFNGMGLYPLPPHRFRPGVAGFAEDIRKHVGEPADRLRLLACQTEFIHHYLACVDELLHPTLPEVRNMDGDKLVFAKSRYVFDAAHRPNVIETLMSLRELEKEGKEEVETKFVWLAFPKGPDRKDRVAKARIRVGPDWLESECNSEARDKALRKRLLKHLDSMMTHESTNLQPFHPGTTKGNEQSKAEAESGSLDLAALPDEARKRIENEVDRQHMSWLDEHVPMLGGKTPRETARTPQGKKQVADMINDWENMQNRSRNHPFCFDFNKLRVELGIALE